MDVDVDTSVFDSVGQELSGLFAKVGFPGVECQCP